MPTTFFDELRAAASGTLGLLKGDRRAPDYFDFSPRGLAGSFIAVLLVVGLSIIIPVPASGGGNPAPFGQLLSLALSYAVQIGAAALVLRQFGRMDGFVPYIVADNWATFFLNLAVTLLLFAGMPSTAVVLVSGVVLIVVMVNITRLIVTLTPLQIAAFLAAQFVGALISTFVLLQLMPVAPEAVPAV